MLRLGPRRRGALAAAGLTAFALAYATTPLVAGGDAEPAALDSALPVVVTSSPAPRIAAPRIAVSPRRDPFAGIPQASGSGEASAASASTAAPAATVPTLPPLPAIPGTIGALPPNAGAGLALGAPPGDGVRVTAVVTGVRASAIVEEPSGTRVVTVGDTVDGDRIRAIDDAGVHLARGTTIPVSPAGQPTPPGWSAGRLTPATIPLGTPVSPSRSPVPPLPLLSRPAPPPQAAQPLPSPQATSPGGLP